MKYIIIVPANERTDIRKEFAKVSEGGEQDFLAPLVPAVGPSDAKATHYCTTPSFDTDVAVKAALSGFPNAKIIPWDYDADPFYYRKAYASLGLKARTDHETLP